MNKLERYNVRLTQTRPWYRDDRKIGRRYRGGTHGGHVLRAAPGEAEPKPTQPAGLEASETTWRARKTRTPIAFT